eukprot:CAMPEP_0206441554 /NCGR_PEP_ID=MMETSP0324_2-20121206/13345_1 /ASSEMBLY_ACC=CAM_ASM_000836 /TAXON_ID=2866 /ORGANISM="Crypthecodinium cohnii, Strain Seligo" /LENGTH=87 /DNA_ID=CAMNT_0053909327 /DNA_START=212 /DNA_END=474 /DNA_ORIENTATION=+
MATASPGTLQWIQDASSATRSWAVTASEREGAATRSAAASGAGASRATAGLPAVNASLDASSWGDCDEKKEQEEEEEEEVGVGGFHV